MKKIFTTKVSIQSSTPTHCYPIIRLPRELKTMAGKIVSVYETECEDEQAFFIVTQVDKLDKLVDKSQETSLESRLSTFESKIDKLIELNFQNNELIESKSLKKNGLGRIRTGDLRRVKAMS